MRPRVLLSDDDTPTMMVGLKRLLATDFEVVGAVQDGRELLKVALEAKPDVILLGVSMPGLNGIEAARRLRKDLPEAKLIFLTIHTDTRIVSTALAAGADGYVLKRCAAEQLVEAIGQVLRGKSFVTPQLSAPVSASTPKGETAYNELTLREREVLQLVAEGMSGKEIAAILKISPKTVAFHKTNIMRALGLHTTAELTRFSVRHGIVM